MMVLRDQIGEATQRKTSAALLAAHDRHGCVAGASPAAAKRRLTGAGGRGDRRTSATFVCARVSGNVRDVFIGRNPARRRRRCHHRRLAQRAGQPPVLPLRRGRRVRRGVRRPHSRARSSCGAASRSRRGAAAGGAPQGTYARDAWVAGGRRCGSARADPARRCGHGASVCPRISSGCMATRPSCAPTSTCRRSPRSSTGAVRSHHPTRVRHRAHPGRGGVGQDHGGAAPGGLSRVPGPAPVPAARMLIVVFNEGLVEYIRHVLPSLGVEGVTVTTYRRWSALLIAKLRLRIPRHSPAPRPRRSAASRSTRSCSR